MQQSTRYMLLMIIEAFVTVMIASNILVALSINSPLEQWNFRVDVGVGLMTGAAFVWALVAYVRARKSERSH